MSLADPVSLFARQAVELDETPSCETGNEYNGRLNLRVAAIFVIWVTSSAGACFPIFAARHKGLGVPGWSFFVAKYFGSGVIVATAFIHLLAPAHEALTNECLTGPITEYPWVEGIAMMAVFILFFVEMMVMRYTRFDFQPHANPHSHSGEPTHGQYHDQGLEAGKTPEAPENSASRKISHEGPSAMTETTIPMKQRKSHIPGEDHLGHQREHQHNEEATDDSKAENYSAQMTAILILEFGVIFHSIFIGLTLAVAGDEFTTLFVVLVFHQTFEGLGLGSRLAEVVWPANRRWTPYILGLTYGLSTPVAIAVGLGIRETYPAEGRTTLIVTGVFDSISAGILIYIGLIELMAHEFMFNSAMQKAKISVVLSAFGVMCLGAGLMALLGKWA